MLRQTMQLLARRPAFRRLWLAGVTTQLGDWVGWVAVSVFTLHAGGGALDLALVFAAHHLPKALLSPAAGSVVDRYDRRSVLVATSVLLAALTLAMMLAAVASEIVWLQALLLVRSAAVALVAPAERAALPRLVDRGELLLAGSFDAASWSMIFAFGMTAGGLLTTLGPALALGIDAASFVVAALLFARLPAMQPSAAPRRTNQRGEPGRGEGAAAAGASASFVDTLRFVAADRRLRFAVFAKAPFDLAAGAAWILVALHVETWVAAGIGFGAIHAVRGVGSGIGPLAIARSGGGTTRWRNWMVVGSAGFILLAVSSSPIVVAAGALLWGAASGVNWVLSTEAQQRITPDGMLGRIGAIDSFAWAIAMCIGAITVALAADVADLAAPTAVVVTLVGAGAWGALMLTSTASACGGSSVATSSRRSPSSSSRR